LEVPLERGPENVKDKPIVKAKQTKETTSKNTPNAGIGELLRTSFVNDGVRIGWRDGDAWHIVTRTEPCAPSNTFEFEGANATGKKP